jgi:hypothetical protein
MRVLDQRGAGAETFTAPPEQYRTSSTGSRLGPGVAGETRFSVGVSPGKEVGRTCVGPRSRVRLRHRRRQGSCSTGTARVIPPGVSRRGQERFRALPGFDSPLYVVGPRSVWGLRRRRVARQLGEWNAEEREGRYTVGSPVAGCCSSLAVAAVSIRTKGGLGHAYAILAPGAVHGGRADTTNRRC